MYRIESENRYFLIKISDCCLWLDNGLKLNMLGTVPISLGMDRVKYCVSNLRSM